MKINIKILTLFLAFFIVGCTDESVDETAQVAPKINVIKPFSTNFSKTITLFGLVAPKDEVAINTPLKGLEILSVNVEVGDYVKKGQTLAVLENVSVKSTLLIAQASLLDKQAELSENLKAFERAKKLKAQNAISAQDFEILEAKVAKTQANIKQIKAQIAEANHQKNKSEIISPVDGKIIKRVATAGAISGDEALFVIAKDGVLEVQAQAVFDDLALLRAGLNANIDEQKGKIRLIDPQIDALSRFGKVYISLDKQDNFIIGSSVSISIALDTKKIDLALPISALSFDESGKASVMAVDKNGVIFKKGVLVDKIGDFYEIKNGLSKDDIVVLSALAFVDEGDKISANLIKGGE